MSNNYDVWYYILDYITDPRDLSSCRQTCKLFNYCLSDNTTIINENNIKPTTELIEYWPSLRKYESINMKFLLSFSKITILDFPLFVENYQDLSVIIMMKNLKKTTIRMSSHLDVILILQFFKDYKSGYVLSDGFFIKQKRTLSNKIFKFIRKNTIRYVKDNVYGLIHTDHSRHLSFVDISLIEELKVKTIITNSIRERMMDNLNIDTVIYPYSADDVNIDYDPWTNCKEYICIPTIHKKRCREIAYVYNMEIDQIRENITKYIIPLSFNEMGKMLQIFPNIKEIGVAINHPKCVDLIINFMKKHKVDITIYHTGIKIPYNVRNYDLINLHELERTIDIMIEKL